MATDGAAPRALILGARSAIAQALAGQLAQQGWDLVLAARSCQRLDPVASDLQLRTGQTVQPFEFDVLDLPSHQDLAERVRQAAGPFELVVCAVGGEEADAQSDTEALERTLATNFTGPAACLARLADDLEPRGVGGIIAISSVAGDRGRQSNYPYGAAKAGLSTFLQGLRNRLHPAGVHVLTVKPGFVDTPLTYGKDGLFLVASPERVAADILRAWKRRKDVVYTPWFWRWLLLIIRSIPERIFKRLSL